MMRTILFLSMVAMAGCGADKRKPDPGPVADVPVLPTLDAISIDAGATTLDLAETQVLSAVGHMSDGTTQAVEAAWSSSDEFVLRVGGAAASTTLVSCFKEGEADVTATFEGHSATVTITVTWEIPADPGVVYATPLTGGTYLPTGGLIYDITIFEYAPDGTRTPVATASGYGNASVLSRDRSTLYLQGASTPDGGTTWNAFIDKYDFQSGTFSRVVDLPAGVSGWAMDIDSKGRLLTKSANTGTAWRIDPVAATVETLGSMWGVDENGDPIGGMGLTGIAVGPDDNAYAVEEMSALYQPAIVKLDTTTGIGGVWANTPRGVMSYYGMVLLTGVTMDRKGTACFAECFAPRVWRAQDVNGNGDALDVGEVALFGTLPTGPLIEYVTDLGWRPMGYIYPMALARGGSVLVSVEPSSYDETTWFGQATPIANPGIYWLTDRDRNGTCDVGEVTRYSSEWSQNTIDNQCMQARR